MKKHFWTYYRARCAPDASMAPAAMIVRYNSDKLNVEYYEDGYFHKWLSSRYFKNEMKRIPDYWGEMTDEEAFIEIL